MASYMNVPAINNASHKTSSQFVHEGLLYQQLKSIFPNEDIQQNVKKDINIKYPSTSKCMEFDIWIPKYELGFEFQDPYHYITTWYHHHEQNYMAQRDNIKNVKAHQEGLSLVIVPCWWNGNLDRLISTIYFHRPDIKIKHENKGVPISLNPPLKFFAVPTIPNVGELMLASFPHSNFFIPVSDYFKWWIGEKYDGVRFCWNPEQRFIYSRYGNIFPTLYKFTLQLPPICIDGELWFGRGQFARSSALFFHDYKSYLWMLRMISFDVPSYDMQKSEYEERYAILCDYISRDHPFNQIVSRLLCKGNFLHWYAQNIISTGGEGIILQKHKSIYEQGRSTLLLKLKTVQSDQEGIVVKVDKNKAVTLKLPNGDSLTVPPQDIFISTPSLGDIVTFSFENNVRQNTPVGPKIYRIRSDLQWSEVIHSYLSDQRLKGAKKFSGFSTDEKGWTLKNVRKFIEGFIAKKVQPKFWYHSVKEFFSSESGRNIFGKLKGKYSQALQHLFPDVSASPDWQKPENRKQFFLDFAARSGFDPLDPRGWYSVAKDKILSEKGIQKVLFHHGQSLSQALLDLFPAIGLERTKLDFLRSKFWDVPYNRRAFFENYAKTNKFDPLVPENWYSQNLAEIMSSQKAVRVLGYHRNSLSRALLDLFPEMDIVDSKFMYHSNEWNTALSRRAFFDAFASANGFDPLVPESWYSQKRSEILSKTGAHVVIYYHNNSVAKALIDLYPSIGLVQSKFLFHKDYWNSAENQRKCFEDYAKNYGFDPLIAQNWHSQSTNTLLAFKGVSKVISLYGNSISRALVQLFPKIGVKRVEFVATKSPSQGEMHRKCFEAYASTKGFDPLIPENWYSQLVSEIVSASGIKNIVNFYERSVSKAIAILFPEIGFERAKFRASQINYWGNEQNRRNFFENYAKANDFDVLHSESWYAQTPEKILSFKQAQKIIQFHNHSLSKSLADLFPEMKFQRSRFVTQQNDERLSEIGYYSIDANRRKFFESYAAAHGFDVLNTENWKLQSKDEILSTQGANHIVSHHGSIPKALVDLFPHMKQAKSKFTFSSPHSLQSPEGRRDFFIRFARKNGFDPRIPENWYLQSLDKIKSFKGAQKVISYHSRSIQRALIDLFPDIGLEKIQFK